MDARNPADLIAFSDAAIWNALQTMQDHGISFPMMMDRILTAATAHIVAIEGPAKAADALRAAADGVDRGLFNKLRPVTSN